MADRGWGILSGTVEVLAYPVGGLAYTPRVPAVRSRGTEGQESEIGGVSSQGESQGGCAAHHTRACAGDKAGEFSLPQSA